MMLAGKKVVVVGGSSGIGLSTAELAKREGADVIIASRNAERLNAAAAKLGVTAIAADVTSDESVASLFRSCGPVDHVVVTAAQLRTGPFKTVADGRRARHHGRQVLGRLARRAIGGNPPRRIADAGLGLPEHSPAAELRDRRRRQRRARIAGAQPRARTRAGARQLRLARDHRHADPRRDAGSRAPRHAGQDRRRVCRSAASASARISRGRSSPS